MRRLLLAAALTGCATAALPPLPPATGGEATVFVPGYKGSFLADASGGRVWLTPGDALRRGDRSLALPFDGERSATLGPLHPDGPVTRLSVLGFGEDVYLPFFEFARDALPGVVPFSYDWRKDVRDSARELCAAIAALPAARVDLVVHSMGGLLALHCLRQGAPNVRRLVFLGTPFAGSVKIWPDLVRGDVAGRNRSLLSAVALFTFPAAWQLLPPSGAFFFDRSGAPAAGDALGKQTWLSGLGIFADPALRSDPAYTAELSRMLAAHDEHWRALAGFAPGIPALVVVGEGHPTISGVRLENGAPDLDHPPKADGDGTVTAVSARPDFPHQEFVTQAGHVEMLREPDVQRAVARFLAVRE